MKQFRVVILTQDEMLDGWGTDEADVRQKMADQHPSIKEFIVMPYRELPSWMDLTIWKELMAILNNEDSAARIAWILDRIS